MKVRQACALPAQACRSSWPGPTATCVWWGRMAAVGGQSSGSGGGRRAASKQQPCRYRCHTKPPAHCPLTSSARHVTSTASQATAAPGASTHGNQALARRTWLSVAA